VSKGEEQSVIQPGETQYFKMRIEFPPQSSGEFYIEAIGDKKGYGLLDPWWNSSWSYKKPVTITYSGSALSNYQVEIITDTQSLITAGKMQSDCDDIRMIDSGEGADDELDYWIHKGCNTTETEIWVKVPSIPDGGKTIYMYYGNSAAAAASSGTNTFPDYYDDCSLLTDWANSGASVYSTDGVPSPSFEATGGNYAYKDIGLTTNKVLEYDGYVIPDSVTLQNLYFLTNSSGAGQMFRLEARSGNSPGLASTASWTSWNAPSGYSPVSAGVWHEVKIALNSTTAYGYVDGASFGSYTFTNNGGYIAVHGDGGSVTGGRFDNIRVRQYSATEPTTEVGSEIEFADVTVASFGSQTNSLNIPSTNQYVGGGFSIVDNTGSRNITGITITEHGTVDAQTNLANVKLYYDLDTTSPYDCASESYNGDESQFGSASSFNGADGTASFTNSVGISTTSTMCVYVVLDVGSGAGNNETLEIKINNPSTEVTASSGTVKPSSAVEISGTTTLHTPPDLQQIHYRWRNNDAGEALSWWDNNWSYRKKITIAAGTGAGTNYQVKLMVGESSGSSGADFNLEGNCQSDFDDIRFVDNDNSTQLDYWIEKITGTTPNQTATVWVEVKDDLDSNVDIYIYYGNSTIGPGSNGTATFIFFDDFSGDLSKWTKHKTSGVYPQIESGYLVCGGGTTASPYGHTALGSDASYTGFQDGIIEGKIYLSTNAIGEIGFRGNYSANTGYKSRMDARSGQGLSHLKPPYSGWGFLGSCSATGIAIGTDAWKDFRATVNGSSFKIEADGQTKTCSDTDYTSAGEISLQNHYGDYTRYDDIRVRKYASTEPHFSSATSQETPSAGATWAANEDTELTSLSKDTIKRLRFEISNEGSQTANDVQYRLEVSEPNPSTCSAATYERVSTDADWEMADSTYITDGESTANFNGSLIDENTNFVAGELKDTGDQTSAITLSETEFTEIEYSIQATASATDGATYCFRLTNAGSINNFTYYEAKYGKVILSAPPVVSNVQLNSQNNIDLIENTTKSVSATADISDAQGCNTITNVTAKIYRSGVTNGKDCTPNNNNCYSVASCTETSCVGTDAVYTCTIDMQFHAEPTDESAEYWRAWVEATDGVYTGSNYSPVDAPDVNTLSALNINPTTINYETVSPDNLSSEKTIEVQTTGNTAIDVKLSGTNMTWSGNTILVGQQKYSASSGFNWETEGATLDETLTCHELSSGKPTESPTNATENVYWKLKVPTGKPAGGPYTGSNTFEAASESACP